MSDLTRIDFHLHSTASDGTVSPAALVRAAAVGGLGALSLTDHDTVMGVPEAQAEAARCGIHLIPGIEVSAVGPATQVHILGLGIDPTDLALLDFSDRAGRGREIRMEAMVERIRDLGFPITMDAVEAEAGPDRESLARPHLARAMVRAGVVGSVWEAFDRYLADDREAYVAISLVEAADAIQLIQNSGGVAIWAHPTDEQLEAELDVLVELGLEGIEVYRPRILQQRIRRLEEVAAHRRLLQSGGSDWHGPEGGESVGSFFVDRVRIEPLLEQLGVPTDG
jgi:predicted metal-dependent phosphoesterase TrpH